MGICVTGCTTHPVKQKEQPEEPQKEVSVSITEVTNYYPWYRNVDRDTTSLQLFRNLEN